MKKIYLPFIILIFGIIFSVIIVASINYEYSNKNNKILQEIDKLSSAPSTITIYDNLAIEDFNLLVELTENNLVASSFVEEALWLSQNNEPTHVGHSLYYLEQYIETGEDKLCSTHELNHIRIYLKHKSFDLAEKQTEIVMRYNDEWVERVTKQYERFPQFYPDFDETLSSIDEVLIKLENKQYDEDTMNLLEFISDHEVC